MYRKLVLFSLCSVISFDAFGLGLRSASDVFNEPAKGSLAQVLLGLAELGVARTMWPGLEREEQLLAQAEKELALVRRLPTTDAERIARIEAYGKSLAETYGGSVKVQVVPPAANIPTIAEELQFVASNQVVTAQEKAARVAAAEEVVVTRRQVALEVAQERGVISSGIRILRRGAVVLLVGDVLGRVYVWNVLESNPGLTPLVGFTAEQIRALLN